MPIIIRQAGVTGPDGGPVAVTAVGQRRRSARPYRPTPAQRSRRRRVGNACIFAASRGPVPVHARPAVPSPPGGPRVCRGGRRR